MASPIGKQAGSLIRTAGRIYSDAKWHIRTVQARRKRANHPATAICITGSSGKSTTSALLAHILASVGPTLQEDFGNSHAHIIRLLLRLKPSHRYIVAEAAISHPGHMQTVNSILQPNVAVVTMVGIEHYSRFRTREMVSWEKGYAVAGLPADGLAVLNADDNYVSSMANRTSARIATYGTVENADYRVLSKEMSADGLMLRLATPRGEVELQTRLLADHFWLSTAAAVATACELGVPFEIIRDCVATFTGVFTRFQLHHVTGGPDFVLDTAKAPRDTLQAAFDAFDKLPAQKKRIVLGHISDYPGNPRKVYRDAYQAARAVSDQVIFVGENSHRSKASQEDRDSSRFLAFVTPRQVFDYLRENAGENELILLKGSANLHLERIGLAWDRKIECWQPACGMRIDCPRCGLLAYPFDEHKAIRRSRKWRRSPNRNL